MAAKSREPGRARGDAKPALTTIEHLPPLPLDVELLAAVFRKLGLSSQQCRIVEMVLRDQSDKQIAVRLKLAEPTVRTYLDRIGVKAGTRGRMQLAMRVMAVSHEVGVKDKRRPK